jgi:hypothetical protein
MDLADRDPVPWEILLDDGVMWLHWPGDNRMVHLGPQQPVCSKLAELLADCPLQPGTLRPSSVLSSQPAPA